jgi:hypothetical protein
MDDKNIRPPVTKIGLQSFLLKQLEKKMTQGWVVNGFRRHTEPLGDNDPPQLFESAKG